MSSDESCLVLGPLTKIHDSQDVGDARLSDENGARLFIGEVNFTFRETFERAHAGAQCFRFLSRW